LYLHKGNPLQVVGNGLSSTFPAGREEETDPIQVSFSASYERVCDSLKKYLEFNNPNVFFLHVLNQDSTSFTRFSIKVN
jgi:hypothetical protein